MMATGESGDGPADDGPGSGYPKFLLLLLLATATIAAVLLAATAAVAVIPLNFATTACSADHISLFSMRCCLAILNMTDKYSTPNPLIHSLLTFIFSIANTEIPSATRNSSTRSSGAPANSVVLHKLGAPLFWHLLQKQFFYTGTSRIQNSYS